VTAAAETKRQHGGGYQNDYGYTDQVAAHGLYPKEDKDFFFEKKKQKTFVH